MFVIFYKIIFQIRGTCITEDLVSIIKMKPFHSVFNII